MKNTKQNKIILDFILSNFESWKSHCNAYGADYQMLIDSITKKSCVSKNQVKKLTRAYLDTLFDYDIESRKFIWKAGRFKGREAGKRRKGCYADVSINGKRYRFHRIVWVYFHDEDPDLIIDHINGDIGDNRIENLRLATQSQNSMNSRIQENSKSGCKGVTLQDNKWVVRLNVKGKNYSFGTYKDLELACLVSEQARDKYHGDFAKS